ncbi:Predicted O-methyltransferase YrrM [Chitinophaga costaii]|uniref:Predicted O-methyltransferase YrrM n=1 Tax=Chitinophaga costaii TaxID=1335309 RepID=A0A1C4BYZ4_9BACT|nr:O-methyltransferase [Chitinophaga costaii]PUZ27412.1 O-methyltransferase [Chitinophaga costaii]SCC12107.1 Predicted O-methyltransferase YrrM [Chitinophaga costaii]
MKDTLPATIEAYAALYTTPESEVLARLNRETHMKVEQAHMLSGHLQGQFLRMLSQVMRPQRVLEIGTYTGYSAICLAAGLPPDGHLHTIDSNEELEDMALRYFKQAGLEHQVTLHIGKAASIIPQLHEIFDLVFIDADKGMYETYFDMVLPMVKTGGIILADNVLYHGQVMEEIAAQSSPAKAMVAFCEKIKADERVEEVLLTVRDGLLMMRKK